MAKTYTQLRPDASIIILESADSVGGVWSSTRLYPGLKTNNLLGSYENPDFPMTPETFGVESAHHIPGPVVHSYLDQFARHYNLLSKVRYRHKVDKVEEQDHVSSGDWKLTVKRPASGDGSAETVQFTADKLVIATGVTNHPNLPRILGDEQFNSPIYHARDFYQHQGLLHNARRVVVYGGAKSAWDGVYAYATAGVEVDWVMRESGRGPCWMAPPFMADGSWLENVAVTRLFAIFGPCWWTQGDGFDWLRWLLHSTIIGNFFVNIFWSSFEKTLVKLNGYDTHPEIEKLKPWSGVWWAGTSLSILNYPTGFFDLLRSGKVRVHHGDIVSLSQRKVHLSNGRYISDIDALHCSTGWKHEPPIQFSPLSLAIKLGLPVNGQNTLPHTNAARKEVISRFAMLRQQPNVNPRRKRTSETKASSAELSPYRLYRHTVPPSFWEKRNICFLGTFLSLGQPVSAQCQSLWAAAYLDGALPSQSRVGRPLAIKEIEWETELQTSYHSLRSPASCGSKHGEFTFETVPFYDLLLRDLGLKTKRKPTWWKEMTEPYGPGDYKGLVDEWSELLKKRE